MHAIDPRRRVIGAVAFAVVVAVSYDFTALFTALILSLAHGAVGPVESRGGRAPPGGAIALSTAALGGAPLVV
jgi:hypothetical protein